MKKMALLVGLLCLLVLLWQTQIIPSVGNQATAKYKSNIIILNKIAQAVMEHHQDTGQWPDRASDLVQATVNANWQGPYANAKDLLDPWGQPYVYQADPKSNAVTVCTLGSDQQPGGDSLAADVTLLMQDGEIEYHYGQFCQPIHENETI